jgi:signal transduction histidine kinase/CheY-like chemotaxis protein
MTDSPNIDGRSVKLLVVDDEEIVLSLARDALEDAGYEIELADGSMAALSKMEREYFDFMLTDIRMPDIDGIELAKKARELNPSIGIIFMTGYANLNSAKDAIKEGAYDYIMKPFELNEIRQAVKNAVRKKSKDVEKTLYSELTRLSDLNQLMYTVGDRKSLLRLSLGFAIMQTKAKKGAIIYETENENEIGIIATEDLNNKGFEESTKTFDDDYLALDSDDIKAPFIISSIEDHPLYKNSQDPGLKDIILPPWYKENDRLINIALKGARKLYGFLIMGFSEDGEPIRGSALKFLTITANQIAVSLENIALLEETRTAYDRLKELQSQSIQLEKMAAKGQMSAEIGHELNNFLGVVIGNLSLMEHHLEEKNYDEIGKYLKASQNNLANIKKFSDGLMDFSGMDSSFESCDLNTLIGDTIDYVKTQRHFADIDVQFDSSGTAISTRADISQIQQLMYNLIYNAADAIKEKKDAERKLIKIETAVDFDTEEYNITISDTGIGIPQNYMEAAFKEKFTTKKSGHGLGLIVCKRIIENHQGRLKINSTPDIGTTIKMAFPLQREPEKSEIPA